MDSSFGQIILVAGDSEGEETFWMQILVLVVLASLVWVGSLIKTKTKELKGRQRHYPGGGSGVQVWLHWWGEIFQGLKDKWGGIFSKAARPKEVAEKPMFDFSTREVASGARPGKELGEEKSKDLHGGMEMLKLDFLLGVVEKTKNDGKANVMLRKLSFNELARRGELKSAGSNALKVYAVNKGNLYGKDIQCEAMKELATRTK